MTIYFDNYLYRKGGRTDGKFGRDIYDGSKRQLRVLHNWMDRHNSLNLESRFEGYDSLTPGSLTGEIIKSPDFQDKGDFRIHVINGTIKNFEIEIKQLAKFRNVFYFKKSDVRRCLKLHTCIAYVHHFELLNPKFRIFSIEELKNILLLKDAISIKYMYDGKPCYRFKEDEFSDWVDFNSLLPLEQYKQHLNKLS